MKVDVIYITDGYPLTSKDVFSKDDLAFLVEQDWRLHVLPRLRNLPTHFKSQEDYPYLLDTSLVLPLWKRGLALFSWRAVVLLYKEIVINISNKTRPRVISLLNAVALALCGYNALKKYIIKHHLQNKPILIYAFWLSPIIIGASFLRKEFPKLRIVSRLHGVDLYAERNNGYLPFRFWRGRALDVLAPCSEQGCNYLRNEGVLEEKIVKAYLGVPSLNELASLGPSDALHLVSCCFVSPIKRMLLLAKSLLEFAKKYPDQKIVWHHLGGGEGLVELQNTLERSPQSLTAIFHGNMSTENVREFFLGKLTNGLDGFICVSESEGLPVSMMEAQMAGIPIVSTDVGGVAEIVNDLTGVLIPKDFSQEEFNTAVLALAKWKNEASRINILKEGRAKFSMQNYQKFINEVLWKQFY